MQGAQRCAMGMATPLLLLLLLTTLLGAASCEARGAPPAPPASAPELLPPPAGPGVVSMRAPTSPAPAALRCAYTSSAEAAGGGRRRTPPQGEDSAEDHGEVIMGPDGSAVEVCQRASRYCYALWEEAAPAPAPVPAPAPAPAPESPPLGQDGSPSGLPAPPAPPAPPAQPAPPTVLIIRQGCWESSGRLHCERAACVADRRPVRARNTTRFCCCRGERCNAHVSGASPSPSAGAAPSAEEPRARGPERDFLEQTTPGERRLWLALGCAVAVLVVAGIGAAALRSWRSCSCALAGAARAAAAKAEPDAVRLMEGHGPGPAAGSDRLQLTCLVGQGRYGSVWKGTIQEREVAIKIFPSHHRQYFLNERDIYCLPFMDCSALLSYFGCEERQSVDGGVQYLLVLSYAPKGCLQDYLRLHTLDCATFCHMAQGVARGLAHLHTDMRKGDKVKPCVSHRDLNTRNILVTAELGTVLCDFGFAMKLQGSKYFCNGETQHAETKSINDVGTLRYMAPEVLEGAVNLRDCESSLKQIDVYALGLVLWELATRCSDLYHPNTEIPPYRLPFEAEVGHHPTFEQMQGLVTRHKARPLFPETWWDWAGVRLLRETVEDCWDQDAEARLTALCVQERLSELPVLWDRQCSTMYVSGVSPTVNPTFPNSGACGSIIQSNVASVQTQRCTGTNNINYSVPGGASFLGTNCPSQECSRPLLLGSEENGYSGRPMSQMSSSYGKEAHESTVSEGTVETMVTMSPPEPQPLESYKNSNMTNGNVSCGGYAYPINSGSALQSSFAQSCCYPLSPPCVGPLQAFQGRNPCMERNLMLAAASEEELSCRGNTLVDRSLKHAYESQALVSHDFLAAAVAATTIPNPAAPIPTGPMSAGGPRPATPIPYVQNAVYDLYSTQPKQPNIPGNGNSTIVADSSSGRTSRWPSWGGLKRLLSSKKQLLFGPSRTTSSGSIDPPVSSPPGYYPKDPDIMDCDDVKSNLLIHQNGLVSLAEPVKKSPVIMDTQVCLLPPGKTTDGVVTSITSPSGHHANSPPCMAVSSLESGDDNKAKQQRRPSTLPLVPVKTSDEVTMDHGSIEEQFQKVFGSNTKSESTRRLKDPSLRVKTPGDVPPSVRRLRSRGAKASTAARFSLYDDRMMSGGVISGLNEELLGSAPDISHKASAGSAVSVNTSKQKLQGILKSSRELQASTSSASSF